MNSSIDYTEAQRNLPQLCEQILTTRQPIEITQPNGESLSLIPTSELNSLIETAYLFSSHSNAVRLLDSLQRAQAKTNPPQTLENLRQELGIDEESKISA